jgi:hypothetical protein
MAWHGMGMGMAFLTVLWCATVPAVGRPSSASSPLLAPSPFGREGFLGGGEGGGGCRACGHALQQLQLPCFPCV